MIPDSGLLFWATLYFVYDSRRLVGQVRHSSITYDKVHFANARSIPIVCRTASFPDLLPQVNMATWYHAQAHMMALLHSIHMHGGPEGKPLPKPAIEIN